MIERTSTLKNKYATFKKKYQDLYSKEAWQFIEDELFQQVHNADAPDILMQIYAELDIKPSPARFYHRHLNLLKQNFPIDGDIIEIASGMIPSFANLLAKEQLKIGKGTVTIYEPLLLDLTPKYPNMKLNKEAFTPTTDIKKYSLVAAIMPCEATENILESAIRNQKDFYVAMCGCVHSDYSYFYGLWGTSPELYQERIIDKTKKLLKEYDNGILEVTRLKNTELDYPILYNKR